jgi:hypothetical protein
VFTVALIYSENMEDLLYIQGDKSSFFLLFLFFDIKTVQCTSYSTVNFNIQRDRRPGTIIQNSEYNGTAAHSMPDKGKTGHDLECRFSRHDKHGLEYRPRGHAYCLGYRPIGTCRVMT